MYVKAYASEYVFIAVILYYQQRQSYLIHICEIVKLRETPKAFDTGYTWRHSIFTPGKLGKNNIIDSICSQYVVGMVKTQKIIQWTIRSQNLFIT